MRKPYRVQDVKGSVPEPRESMRRAAKQGCCIPGISDDLWNSRAKVGLRLAASESRMPLANLPGLLL